jgi:hypothetical protein
LPKLQSTNFWSQGILGVKKVIVSKYYSVKNQLSIKFDKKILVTEKCKMNDLLINHSIHCPKSGQWRSTGLMFVFLTQIDSTLRTPYSLSHSLIFRIMFWAYPENSPWRTDPSLPSLEDG